jgi:hypothetical protein
VRQILKLAATTLAVAVLGTACENEQIVSADRTTSGRVVAPEGFAGVTGQNLATGGVGLVGGSGSFDVTVPVGAPSEILSATFYYNGSGPGSDDTVIINGDEYVATLVGTILDAYWYKLDGMALVSPGPNSFDVSGISFGGEHNDGIGLAVVYEDVASDVQMVRILELTDYFYWNSVQPNSMVHNFTVTPSDMDRDVECVFMVGDCTPARPDGVWYHSGVGAAHPGDIVGGPFPHMDNVLNSVNGPEWDIFTIPSTVPADAGHFAFQVESPAAGNGDSGLISFAALLLSEPRMGGGEGCSHGYWKQHLDSWDGTGYTPGQSVESVFAEASRFPSVASATLHEGLEFGGGPGALGGARNLIKQAVAAVLNSVTIDYPLSLGGVIDAVNDALATEDRGTMIDLSEELNTYNNLGCPLN